MQQLIINVADPDDLLTGFGAGALIRVERDTAADMGSSSEITAIAIVAGQTQYEYWDATGAATHYYRTRYSTAAPATAADYSDYSPIFQVGGGVLEYVTEGHLKAHISITDTTDDTLLSVICDRVNQYIESETKQPVGPIPSKTYLYDVAPLNYGQMYHHHPYIPALAGAGLGPTRLFTPMPVDAPTKGIGGLRTVTTVEIAPYTGAAYVTIASTDYFLRERAGISGPFRFLCLSDRPAGLYRNFPVGRATVRVTATAGWDAIPADLTMIAIEIAKRGWNARQAGYQDAVDDQGLPLVARLVTGQERQTLRNYTLKMPGV